MQRLHLTCPRPVCACWFTDGDVRICFAVGRHLLRSVHHRMPRARFIRGRVGRGDQRHRSRLIRLASYVPDSLTQIGKPPPLAMRLADGVGRCSGWPKNMRRAPIMHAAVQKGDRHARVAEPIPRPISRLHDMLPGGGIRFNRTSLTPRFSRGDSTGGRSKNRSGARAHTARRGVARPGARAGRIDVQVLVGIPPKS